MKRVWKCDFCSSTSEDKIDIITHEEGCSWNPINRTCYTCDNRLPAPYYDASDECEIHDMEHFFAVDDGDKICNDWVNSEERARKLKQIKNKIT